MAKEIRDFGPEWIRNYSVKSKVGKIIWWPFSKITLLALWAIHKGDMAAFFVLSIFFDPFITTIYLRKESFAGLKYREWVIFFASAVISNGWWIIRTYVIIFLAKFSIYKLLNVFYL